MSEIEEPRMACLCGETALVDTTYMRSHIGVMQQAKCSCGLVVALFKHHQAKHIWSRECFTRLPGDGGHAPYAEYNVQRKQWEIATYFKRPKPYVTVHLHSVDSENDTNTKGFFTVAAYHNLARPRPNWEGYRFHKNITMGPSLASMEWKDLIKLLGTEPMSVIGNKESIWVAARKITIVTNKEPEQWFPNEDYSILDPLINKIIDTRART